MTQKVRLWELRGARPVAIPEKEIRLENDLEDWLEDDISILDGSLLVIGRQVRTIHGGLIDLLCLNNSGDTVIIELKKGMTPREVTAQALDYASWVEGLSVDDITEIANDYFSNRGGESLQEAFQRQFDSPFPAALNLSHRSLIVAESMDASTTRIVRYLSDLSVPINVATLQHFVDDSGRRMLAQVYLIDPEEAEAKDHQSSKRAYQTVAGIRRMAHENGIGELWDHMRDSVRGLFGWIPYREEVACEYRFPDGRYKTQFFTHAVPRDGKVGLPFFVHATRLGVISGLDVDQIRDLLPGDSLVADEEARTWRFSSDEERQSAQAFRGQYASKEDITRFIGGLRQAVEEQKSKEAPLP